MTNNERPMTLSREDLYELAWSKPMMELAKDFGISDVALAKRCRRLGIPVPGRGYWARVDAGQTPYRPKLPKREEKWHDHSALTVAPSIETERSVQETLEEHSPQGVDAVRARIAGLTVVPTTSVSDVLPAVKRSALRLKHPSRSEWKFNRGERTGPIVHIEVTDGARDRALLLADSLLRATEALGWTFIATPRPKPQETHGRGREPVPESSKPEPAIGRFLVEGEQVGIRIEERLREEPRVPSASELARERREYGYHAPGKTRVPTGNLRVIRLDTYSTYGEPDKHTWYDRKGSRVEDRLTDILLGFYELSQSIKVRRAEDQRKERERQEAERRRQEKEAKQDGNAKLIKQLETDAGAWHRARYLRSYIQAARKKLGEHSLRAAFREDTVDFLDWAEQYVNQLDPLHALARSDDFDKSSSYQYAADVDRLKNAFARLLGSDWPNAWKVGKDYSPPPQTTDRWRYAYREKSVFEVTQPGPEPDSDEPPMT
jgi:hypothetical protein